MGISITITMFDDKITTLYMTDTEFYEHMIKYRVPGICAFILGNSVYILYSRNLTEGIFCKSSVYEGFQLSILETNTPIELLREKAHEYIQKYKEQGYTILNRRSPIKYSIKILINKDWKVEVIKKSTKSRGEVLGVFDTMQQAIIFVNNYKDLQKNLI